MSLSIHGQCNPSHSPYLLFDLTLDGPHPMHLCGLGASCFCRVFRSISHRFKQDSVIIVDLTSSTSVCHFEDLHSAVRGGNFHHFSSATHSVQRERENAFAAALDSSDHPVLPTLLSLCTSQETRFHTERTFAHSVEISRTHSPRVETAVARLHVLIVWSHFDSTTIWACEETLGISEFVFVAELQRRWTKFVKLWWVTCVD